MAKVNLGAKQGMENSEKARLTYTNLLKDENATQEQREEAFHNMFNALQDDLAAKITKEARNEVRDTQVLTSRGQNVLTSEEKTFFNALSAGFADEKLLPVTTVNRVFEDLVKAHPILEALGMQNLGAVTKFIYSDPTRTYAWKELFEGITGQANAVFTEESFTQLKLTSFVVIPNDMEELGPEWVERYVRELLVECMGAGLEFGFVNGRGSTQKEPIGLTKDVNATTGAVTAKTSSGTLTFAPSEFGETVAGELFDVVSKLSVDSASKFVDVAGKVVMVVNPQDAIAVAFRNTVQTANGQWVTALPYNIQIVTSTEIPSKKALFFVKGRYLAALAGGNKIKKFDQTLAMDDATLYTVKRFANGKPKDNKAALLYDLDIDFTPPTP